MTRKMESSGAIGLLLMTVIAGCSVAKGTYGFRSRNCSPFRDSVAIRPSPTACFGEAHRLVKESIESDNMYKEMAVEDIIAGQPFSLPKLPYKLSALEPVTSEETMRYHYGKHHATYIRNLNALVKKDPMMKDKSLEEIILLSEGSLFNNAAQTWNHNLFWRCMKPHKEAHTLPCGELLDAIEQSFGSYDAFKSEFLKAAAAKFGSGWIWLVRRFDGKLVIEATNDGSNPMRTGSGIPILGLDIWEHAYYLDYKNDRAGYVSAWFNIIDWEFVSQRFTDSSSTRRK